MRCNGTLYQCKPLSVPGWGPLQLGYAYFACYALHKICVEHVRLKVLFGGEKIPLSINISFRCFYFLNKSRVFQRNCISFLYNKGYTVSRTQVQDTTLMEQSRFNIKDIFI